MKIIKKIVILSIFIYLLPIKVSAGNVIFRNPENIAQNKYKIDLAVKDISLNYLRGNINVTNGTITNITTTSGWINKMDNNNFYFYHNGIKTGDYVVATFEVTMTMMADSEYSIGDIDYGIYNCKRDIYGNYFDENGNIVSAIIFNNSCGKSKDATLKNLSSSVGFLSPDFSSNNYYYDLNVSNTVNSVDFNVVTSNKYASVSGTKCLLTSNVTECNIIVTSQAGNTKIYNVIVYKKNNTPTNSFIADFKVHNGFLDKEFNINTTSYYLTPNKNAEYIFFSFKLNGANYTTDKCSSASANCKVMVKSGSIKRQYVFNILNDNEEEKEEISNEIKNINPKTSSLKPTTKSLNKKTINQIITKESLKKEGEEVVQDEEEKEETIDPIEYNKENKKVKQKVEKDEKKNEIITKVTSNEKNAFLKFLCIVNVFLGICIGLSLKK